MVSKCKLTSFFSTCFWIFPDVVEGKDSKSRSCRLRNFSGIEAGPKRSLTTFCTCVASGQSAFGQRTTETGTSSTIVSSTPTTWTFRTVSRDALSIPDLYILELKETEL